MKPGSMLLVLVLLTVLAIPLFADHTLGNTVGESSAMSIPVKEEVPVKDVTAPYSEIIGIPPKPIPSMWLPYCNTYIPIKMSGETHSVLSHTNRRKSGGVRRIKSGRH